MSLSLAGNGTLTGVDADASGLLAEAGGIGSNVVQAVKTDTFSTSSTSFTTVTGLSVTITPTSASSKVLLIGQLNYSPDSTSNRAMFVAFSGGNAGTYIGDAAGNRTRAVNGTRQDNSLWYSASALYPSPMVYLDSPATTSATTYTIQVSVNAGTGYVNRPFEPNDVAYYPRGASSLTAIEVAA